MEQVLSIKNMVCDRCIKVVGQVLHGLALTPTAVGMGTVTLSAPLTHEAHDQLAAALAAEGFELIDDQKTRLTEEVKRLLLHWVRTGGFAAEQATIKTSVRLAEATGMDYAHLSAVFSATAGVTIEKYIILQKIERAKELIAYNELTMTEIADGLGYSSVQHLSNQFRKITGLSPTEYKNQALPLRKSLDAVHQ